MKKTIFILSAITTLFFAACKKDNDKNTGNNTYQPFGNGSEWKYRNTSSGEAGGVDTTVNTMTAQTKAINGKTFHVLNSVTGSDSEETYIGLHNNIYSTFVNSGFDAEEGLEIAYLNDTKAAGESWTVNTTVEDEGEELEVRIKTTIVEKGITKTVLNKAYSNVIHSQVELQAKFGAEFFTISQTDYYTAKGVGVVGIYVSNGETEILRSELYSHTIK